MKRLAPLLTSLSHPICEAIGARNAVARPECIGGARGGC